MKSSIFTLLASALIVAQSGLAQNFTSGQAARLIIGQPNFTAQSPRSSQTVLGGVGGMVFVNGTLIVTDANRVGAFGNAPSDQTEFNNHRVLIYRNFSSQIPGVDDAFPQISSRCAACLGTPDVVLGQTDFSKFAFARGRAGLRLPTGVASDGTRVAVADTDNNRILIWNTIPTANGQAADVVLGQTDFDRGVAAIGQTNMRGPQSVWIQDGRLFVADTMNNRILVWNRVPTSNNAPADFVLGQPDFTSGFDPFTTDVRPTSRKLQNPTSVTSDGRRLYVADLGHNRILIWNSIPASSNTPADIVLGQPDFESAVANNREKLCASNGTDSDGKLTYPERCGQTMNFPRFALSDGTRLYVADTGNDRVLVWNSIPNASNIAPDAVLGQPDAVSNFVSDQERPERSAASDALRSPLALASDGKNLFVTDAFNRRVLVYTVGRDNLPLNAVTNAASRQIRAIGWVQFSGNAKVDDEITIRLNDARDYKYKVVTNDTLGKIAREFTALINKDAGDPDILANLNEPANTVVLLAKTPGSIGDTYQIVQSTAGANNTAAEVTVSAQPFFGGRDAARLGPGTIISITGTDLAGASASAAADSKVLPRELAETQVFIDGVQVPLFFVSPTQINAQLPFEVNDTTSASLIVRTKRNGIWQNSRAIPINVTTENPGIFTFGEQDPPQAVAFHSSSFATSAISLEGSNEFPANVEVAITLDEGDAERVYTYTTVDKDTKEIIRDKLIEKINTDPDSPVVASQGSSFVRILIRSKIRGQEGEGLKIGLRDARFVGTGATPTYTWNPAIYGTDRLCCSSTERSPVTEADPAVPNEQLIIVATGLGLARETAAREAQVTGQAYSGPTLGEPNQFVNGNAGPASMQVLSIAPQQGSVGIFEVLVQLPGNLPTNPRTIIWLGQNFTVSNQATIPVKGVEVIVLP
jgi:hypothetical protein